MYLLYQVFSRHCFHLKTTSCNKKGTVFEKKKFHKKEKYCFEKREIENKMHDSSYNFINSQLVFKGDPYKASEPDPNNNNTLNELALSKTVDSIYSSFSSTSSSRSSHEKIVNRTLSGNKSQNDDNVPDEIDEMNVLTSESNCECSIELSLNLKAINQDETNETYFYDDSSETKVVEHETSSHDPIDLSLSYEKSKSEEIEQLKEKYLKKKVVYEQDLKNPGCYLSEDFVNESKVAVKNSNMVFF